MDINLYQEKYKYKKEDTGLTLRGPVSSGGEKMLSIQNHLRRKYFPYPDTYNYGPYAEEYK
jgi:hypothetical protein